MPRKGPAKKRPITPDPVYNNRMVARFINRMMVDGKKSVAERIFYDALQQVETRAGRPGIEVFEEALRRVMPVVEVKPRRVGGATYQVPVDIRAERRMALAIRWLLRSARARGGRSMAEKLAGELMDAATNQGATIKRREDTHRMAEANRAFIHYRW